VAEFRRSILVYYVVKFYSIKELKEVTRTKIEHFSELPSIFNIYTVVA
jgi:hypothetical protein